jgi:hypothetical protein
VEYTITAEAIKDKTTAKTGYIKLSVGDKIFISQQIDKGQTISFILCYDEETEVTIIEGWGTSSVLPEDRDIISGEKYTNLK